QILRGRLVDLQGQSAANVQVELIRIAGTTPAKKPVWVNFDDSPKQLSLWHKAVTTDKQGRFTLRGLASDWKVTVRGGDERFALQSLEIKARSKDKPGEVTLALAPAYLLEGIVLFADTGKPVPGARLRVSAEQERYRWPMETMDAKADAKGRFRVSAPVGNYFMILAYPPVGTPYLLLRKEFTKPKPDVLKKEIQMALPRGVLVRGKVTEVASGKPVAGAAVEFEPNRDNNPYFREDVRPFMQGWGIYGISNAKGEFDIPVLPGPGHLLIAGPTPDYVRVAV